MTTLDRETREAPWHSRPALDAAAAFDVDPNGGLDDAEVGRRLEEYGPNELPKEPPPSLWEVARGQLSNPMNIMLLIVAVASFAIGQIPTGVFVFTTLIHEPASIVTLLGIIVLGIVLDFWWKRVRADRAKQVPVGS